MSTQQIIDQAAAPPMPDIGETLTADFSSADLPTLLSGPRVFDGKTLWPHSYQTENLQIMLAEPSDTHGLTVFLLLNLLSDMQADCDAAIKNSRDRHTAEGIAISEALKKTSRQNRDMYRGKAFRSFSEASQSQLSEALALYDSITKEARDSQLISTGSADGSPNG